MHLQSIMKKSNSKKSELLSSMPASISAGLYRKHRGSPFWARKLHVVKIKSSYLMWHAITEQNEIDPEVIKVSESSFLDKESAPEKSIEMVDLRGATVTTLAKTKKGYPFIITPAPGNGKPITFMAVNQEVRSCFVAAVKHASNPVQLSDFKVLAIIGKGYFGTIMLAHRRDDEEKKLLAIKEIKLSSLRSKSRIASIQMERAVLQKVIGNPFVVGLEYAFVNSNGLYMVMEFMHGGDFHNYMKTQGVPLSKETAQFYGAQLLLALEYLHAKNIIHRDIKPENILLDKEGHLKLTDLGLAKQLKSAYGKTNTFCGTDVYLAPEVLDVDSKRCHGVEVDFWQYGNFIYEMLVGKPAFYEPNFGRSEIHEAILEKEVEFPNRFDEDAADLIRNLLVKDHTKRLRNWEAVKQHKFFEGLDWNMVYKKEINPPVEFITSTSDFMKNFDTRVTSIPLRLQPAKELTVDDFIGFEFSRSGALSSEETSGSADYSIASTTSISYSMNASSVLDKSTLRKQNSFTDMDVNVRFDANKANFANGRARLLVAA